MNRDAILTVGQLGLRLCFLNGIKLKKNITKGRLVESKLRRQSSSTVLVYLI